MEAAGWGQADTPKEPLYHLDFPLVGSREGTGPNKHRREPRCRVGKEFVVTT